MSPSCPARLSGLILAGGSSSRMGRDKARLDLDGRPLLLHVAAVLASCCDDITVASGDGRRLRDLGLPQVADVVAAAGPLGGLAAGLVVARHDLVAVVATDMPRASAAVLGLLAARWDGQDAVVPVAGGRPQPLHAVWARRAAAPLRALLERGERSVTAALDGLDVCLVPPAAWRWTDPSDDFADNVNRPEDLARLASRETAAPPPATAGRRRSAGSPPAAATPSGPAR